MQMEAESILSVLWDSLEDVTIFQGSYIYTSATNFAKRKENIVKYKKLHDNLNLTCHYNAILRQMSTNWFSLGNRLLIPLYLEFFPVVILTQLNLYLQVLYRSLLKGIRVKSTVLFLCIFIPVILPSNDNLNEKWQ